MEGLVINLGLKSVRAIAFDARGGKLASASLPVQTLLRDSWIEQDPNEWWDKAATSVRRVLEDVGSGAPRFVTVTASAACLAATDEAGTPLRDAIMVSDRRAVAQSEAVAAAAAFEDVRAINASFQADPYFLVPKALWIAQNEPEVYEKARWLLTPADFLILRLTGEVVTDPLNAEKYFYDVSQEEYPRTLLNELGLDAGLFPPVGAVGEEAGRVTSEAASATGLEAGTPVRLATYDAICAFWGSGVREAGDVADVSGTVTSVRILADRGLPRDEQRLFTQPAVSDDLYVLGGSNNLGGGLIEWLKQGFYAEERLPYELIESESEASGLGARGVLFLPYLLGERAPVWDADARGVFFGLERQHQRGDFARAVCESAAFAVEHILRVVRGHGIELDRLRVSGGLARLDLVNRIKADVTRLPTEVLEEFETTAVGAFLIAGAAAGTFDSLKEAATTVRVREIILPNEERGDRYMEWFDLYLRLYDSLRDLFRDRQRLYRKHGLGGVGRLENL